MTAAVGSGQCRDVREQLGGEVMYSVWCIVHSEVGGPPSSLETAEILFL